MTFENDFYRFMFEKENVEGDKINRCYCIMVALMVGVVFPMLYVGKTLWLPLYVEVEALNSNTSP